MGGLVYDLLIMACMLFVVLMAYGILPNENVKKMNRSVLLLIKIGGPIYLVIAALRML